MKDLKNAIKLWKAQRLLELTKTDLPDDLIWMVSNNMREPSYKELLVN